jgi:hypothetical protein
VWHRIKRCHTDDDAINIPTTAVVVSETQKRGFFKVKKRFYQVVTQ